MSVHTETSVEWVGTGWDPVRGDYTRFHWSLSVVVKRGPRAAIGATRDEFWFTKTNSGIIDLMSNRNALVRSSQPITASSSSSRSLLIQRVSRQAWLHGALTNTSRLGHLRVETPRCQENNKFVTIRCNIFIKLLARHVGVNVFDVFMTKCMYMLIFDKYRFSARHLFVENRIWNCCKIPLKHKLTRICFWLVIFCYVPFHQRMLNNHHWSSKC